MANRVPLVISNQQMREITNGDTLDLTGNPLIVGGNLTPAVDSAYDLGSPTKKWKELHLSGNTLYLGTIRLRDSGGGLGVYDSTGSNQVNISITGGTIYPDAIITSGTIQSGNIQAGDVTLSGNLTVNGTTTTINSTTLSVNDKNIVLADSAADSAAANGAGITINGSNATITYNSSADTFDFNKGIGGGKLTSSNFNSAVSLVIYDSAGSAIKTLYGAAS